MIVSHSEKERKTPFQLNRTRRIDKSHQLIDRRRLNIQSSWVHYCVDSSESSSSLWVATTGDICEARVWLPIKKWWGCCRKRKIYSMGTYTIAYTQSGAVKRWTQSLSELIGRLLIVRFMTNCFCPHNNKIIAELRHWFYRMAHTPSHSITSQSTHNAHCLWRCGTNTFIMLRCHWIYWFGSIDYYRLVAIL